MTKQYITTEAKFADWLDRDMGDAFIHDIVLEKNSDGTFSQGMTRIKFNAFCAGLQSLPELTTEPVGYGNFHASGVMLGYRLKPSVRHTAPLYTHAQPLQTITADDVTDEMAIEYFSDYPYMKDESDNIACAKRSIVSSVNVYLKHRGDTK